MSRITALLLLIALGVAGCFVVRTYDLCPKEFTVKDRNGRELAILFIERDDTHFRFTRRSDAQMFVHPIEDLDLSSRMRLFLHPKADRISQAPKKPQPPLKSSREDMPSAGEYYYRSLKEKLEAASDKKVVLTKELRAKTNSRERRTILKEISMLETEIRKLEWKIQKYDTLGR